MFRIFLVFFDEKISQNDIGKNVQTLTPTQRSGHFSVCLKEGAYLDSIFTTLVCFFAL